MDLLLGQVGVARTKCWQHSQLSPPLQKAPYCQLCVY